MSCIDRVILSIVGCGLWILILGELINLPDAQAQAVKVSDRQMSQILHEIVGEAIAGKEPSRSDGYDELEDRLRAVLSQAVQGGTQTESRISRQEIRSAVTSCRVTGTLSKNSNRLDAKLSC